MKNKQLIWFLVFIFFSLDFSIQAQCLKLIWSDEFEGDTLDLNKWKYELGDGCPALCQWGNNEKEYYRKENVSVKDGNLIITALNESINGYSYSSGRIITKDIADWTYGRYEARMKLPKGKGIWPAFWLLPTSKVYGEWPNSGEIDIMELLGNQPNKMYGSVHFGPPYNHFTAAYTLPSGDFSQDYHVFALEWTADSLKWLVDDKVYTARDRSTVNPWPFDEQFYIVLNLAVGGNWPGNPDGTTVFPQQMFIDWIHVYNGTELQKIRQKGIASKLAKDVVYSVLNLPDEKYFWTVPSDMIITSGKDSSSITVHFGCKADTVKLRIEAPCDTVYRFYSVKFSSPTLTGIQQVYPKQDNLVYQISNVTDSRIFWAFPKDVELLNTSTDSTIKNVKWGCENGTIKTDISNVCDTFQLSLPVNVLVPAILGVESTPLDTKGLTYTVINNATAVSYSWSVSGNSIITAGQGTDKITLDIGNKDDTLSVTIQDPCKTDVYRLPIRISTDITYCTFEGSILDFHTFSGAAYEMITNTFQTAIDSSSHIGKVCKSKLTYSGIYVDLSASLDFTVNKYIKLKVMGPKTGIIRCKLENPTTGKFIEKNVSLTEINQWQDLYFDFSGTASNTYNRITLFFDFGSTAVNCFYFDDLIFSSSINSIEDRVDAINFSVFPNPADDRIEIKSNLFLIDEICISDISSRIIYKNTKPMQGNISISLKGFDCGFYFISVRSKENIFSQKLIKR